MQIISHYPLKMLNTFQVEARADQYVRFDMPDQIVDFFKRPGMDQKRRLVLGQGSNLLFVKDFHGLVLHPVLEGMEVIEEHREHVLVRAGAGQVWDDLVAWSVANGWGGLENLSLIPGFVGASAVQNIGAYGVEVKDTIARIEAVSIADGRPVQLNPRDCGFAYRYSHFKGAWKDRFIITAVIYRLRKKPNYVTQYAQVAETVRRMGTLNLATLRKAIVHIREQKLPDPTELPNAGSFFKNPVLENQKFAALKKAFPRLPHYDYSPEAVKVSAAWLIEQCGWKGRCHGNAAVYDKHALVLINRGGASGREIFELSERIRNAVSEKFGVPLEREVQVVG